MGNNALRHNHGSQLGELGFLASSEKLVGAPGNTYTIAPYLGSGSVKLVRVPRGDGTFFDLDFRKTSGSFDTFAAGSPATVGVTIRLAAGTASPDVLAQGHGPHRHHALDERPQGRPAPRRQDGEGPRVDDLVHDAVVGRRGGQGPGQGGDRPERTGLPVRVRDRHPVRLPLVGHRDRQHGRRELQGHPQRDGRGDRQRPRDELDRHDREVRHRRTRTASRPSTRRATPGPP